MGNHSIITIFGGSGFVGRAIAARLAKTGATIRIATRTPQACYDMRPFGTPGQIVPMGYDPARPETMAPLIQGASVVINCVGMLFQKRRRTFHAAHTELPRQIATACKRHGVHRFIHISALGVDRSGSQYAHTKQAGEKAIRDIFPGTTILRPSVIFGPGDGFFNLFATLAQYLPALPLIGGGVTRFQPVYVGDVAAAVAACLEDSTTEGQTYELGGPDIVTFRDVYDRLFAATGRPRPLIPLPWGLAKLKARFWELLPTPLLTVDQVVSLQTDNVVSDGALTLKDLGVQATAIETILPTYLDRFRPGGKFAEQRRA